MQEKRHDRVVEMRLCFFSGKVGDYKMLFVATRKCRSTAWYVLYVFGNANNGANAGLPYVNANNGSGNANWNIGGVLLNAYNGKYELLHTI